MHALLLAIAVSIPATVHENMLFVQARVDGGPPRTFIIATSAPRSYVTGGPADREAELDIGGAKVKIPKLGVMDLGFFERTEDLKLDGVIGMDVLRQFVVEIDFDAGLIRLHDLSGAPAPSPAQTVVPLRMKENKPYFTATIKMPGKRALQREFLLDTGSGGAIADELFKPVGEPIGPDLGRAEVLEIGSFRFRGANGINTPGRSSIGGEILKRFHIIADFARGRMILEPNRHFADALLFDTSGLEMENDADGFKVVQVYKRTPAAEAGLLAGDVVTAIDGQDARVLGLNRVRLMFHSVRTHELSVRRGGKTLSVTLALRKLL